MKRSISVFLIYFLWIVNSFSQVIVPGDTSGYTQGQFNVTESGAAVYSIPITMSPGTAGMQPSLTLAYNSQGGNGLLGQGWSMQGFSTIGRSAKTYAQDGQIKGVSLDTSDRFSLDGERLIVANGTYGGNNTNYRTEQNAFIKIVSLGNVNGAPDYFKAYTKSGLIMTFGASADSKIEAQGSSNVLFWLVHQIEDTKGNYITFDYFENNPTGEYYPTRIDYTGHTSPFVTPYNSIQFFYTSRSDSTTNYIKGSAFQSKKLLSEIKTFNGSNVVRGYSFAYQQGISTNCSQLISVTECGSDGHCFTPTTFNWSADNSLSFNPPINSLIPTSNLNDAATQIRSGDWNGDGIQDLMDINYNTGINHFYINNRFNNFSTNSLNAISTILLQNKYVYIADFNADGKSDVFAYYPFTGENYIFINNGNLNFTQITNPIPVQEIDGTNGTQLTPGDWNGDGLSDILWYDKNNGSNHWFTNNGNTTFTEISNPINISQISGGTNIYPTDWNADGIVDLLWYDQTTGNTRCFINNNLFSFIQTNNVITPSLLQNGTNIDLSDWNGDGVIDLMWIDKATGNSRWFYNKGNLTFLQVTSNLTNPDLIGTNLNFIFSDFNGDGKNDFLSYDKSTGTNKWFLNDGHLNFNSPFSNLIDSSEIKNGTQIILGGFSTLGIVDLMWYDSLSGSNHWFENNIQRTNFINSIINGHGSEIVVNYSPLIDTSVYLKENNASYPLMDFSGAYHVVSSYQMSNGVGGFNSFSYRYEGAKIDLRGRGLRGFTKVHIKDETTGITQNKIFSRDYKFISSPMIHEDSQLSDGTIIAETDYVSDLKIFYGDSCHYSFIKRSVSRSYELDGSLINTTTTDNEYDDYGNPILCVVNYGDGHRDSTINNYHNDQNTWILGRLWRSELYRFAPNQPSLLRTSEFEYDVSSGLLIKEIIFPDSGVTIKVIKEYFYDSFGNITQDIISAWNGSAVESRTTTTSFDNNGRFTLQASNALGHTTSKTYDQLLGHVLTETDANNLSTIYEYDGFGRMIKKTSADGNWIKLDYRKCNGGNSPALGVFFVEQQSSIVPPSFTYYDLSDREIRNESNGFNGNSIFIDKIFNARGQLTISSDPYFQGGTVQNTTFGYDTVGRKIIQSLPGNRISLITYNGLLTTETNPLGQHKSLLKDVMGQMVQTKDNQNNVVNYEYSAAGNLLKTIDPNGNVIEMRFDSRGNKIWMKDPDMGIATYMFNSFGELISQTDANGLTTLMQYDLLGRLVSRQQLEGITTWQYDTQYKGIGKLSSIASYNNYVYLVTYDSLSRVISESQNIDGGTYNNSQTFDQQGRIATVTYPSGFKIKNIYNLNGYLSEVRRESDNFIYWQANVVNARGQLEQLQLGNGLITDSYFNLTTGFLDSLHTVAGSSTIQDHTYSFNAISSLIQRKNLIRNVNEVFQYDNLNRLIKSQIIGGDSVSVSYDILGNIISKSDIGVYNYGGTNNGPHRISSINLFSNDCINSLEYEYKYTSFNKVKEVDFDSTKLFIGYGPDNQRNIQSLYHGNQLLRKKIYISNLYEKQIDSTNYRELHYIRVNGGVIAVVTKESSGILTTQYWHKDQLGSLQAVSDSAGNLLEELSYDAWGKRRNADGSAISDTATHIFARGFTGHEHYDLFDLVDMNGRVYDPFLGRFLSADPSVQFPDNLQSLNRYSYVLNNPLSYTDPSGFSLWSSIRDAYLTVITLGLNHIQAVQHAAEVGANWTKENWKTLAIIAVGIGVGALTGGFGGTLFMHALLSGAGYGLGSAMAATLLSGGSLGDATKAGVRGAVIGGATAAATFGVGSLAEGCGTVGGVLVKTAGHGLVQGGATEVQGGKFIHGFYAGAVTGATEDAMSSIASNQTVHLLSASVLGGTTSAIGGGKFANGAISAAYVTMFNHFSHPGDGASNKKEYSLDDPCDPPKTGNAPLDAWNKTVGRLGEPDGYAGFCTGKLVLDFIQRSSDGQFDSKPIQVDTYDQQNILP